MRPNHSPEPIAVGEISHHAKGFARPDSSRSKNPSRPHQSGVALRFPPHSMTRSVKPPASANPRCLGLRWQGVAATPLSHRRAGWRFY